MKDQKLLKEGWRKFLKILEDASNREAWLAVLLTQKDKEDLSKRTLIIEALLKKEKPQREISKDLKVSIAKITRGSGELRNISSAMKKFFDDGFL